MVGEKLADLLWSELASAVQSVEQGAGLCGHDDDVPDRCWTGVPERVRHAVRPDDGTSCGDFMLIVTDPDREPAFQDIPGFVVLVMDVEGRLVLRRLWTMTSPELADVARQVLVGRD